VERTAAITESAPARRALRVALVANAGSGSCDPDQCAEWLRSFGAEVEPFAIDELERAVATGADRLVVAGGDGSIAPVAAAAGRAGTPLGLLPAGTANDFARRMGIPPEMGPAARLAARGTAVKNLELGWMDDRPFVNVASAGLPGPAARTAKAWMKPLGKLGYAAGALLAGVSARAVSVEVSCDRASLFEGDAWQVTVAASGAFGAGARIDEADPHDGELEVIAVEAGPRPGLVALAYRLRSGKLGDHPRARHARCKHAAVQLRRRTEFNVDGEIVECGSVQFRGEADAFSLVVG
jgi:diacylglycerol kinase family enzyme